jgi:hypothetical protein
VTVRHHWFDTKLRRSATVVDMVRMPRGRRLHLCFAEYHSRDSRGPGSSRLRCKRFYDPPFDRRRFLLFPASWPFIDEFGCVLWIDPDWQVLGASEILFFNAYPT